MFKEILTSVGSSFRYFVYKLKLFCMISGALVDCIKTIANGDHTSERDFDLIFPPLVRKLSRVHWTPLAAAQRACQLLVKSSGDKVLDIGSGSGKLCLVGALTTKGSFTGVEKDRELVRTAKKITQEHKIERVRFVHGNAFDLNWAEYDALYLYNPFANDLEIKKESLHHITVREDTYVQLVNLTIFKLGELPAGIRIVTYHGFGGEMPPNIIQESSEIIGTGVLQLWLTVRR